MNKISKLLAVLVCVLLCTATLLAQGASPVKNGAVSKEFKINGEVASEDSELVFNDITELDDKDIYEVLVSVNNKMPIIEVIEKMNFVSSIEKEEVSKVSIVKTVNTNVEVYLEDAVMLTEFQNLDLLVNGKKTDGEHIQATWEVPNLNENLGYVYVMHYSTTRSVFEVIEPDVVDFENKAVTATFEDLSPVAVFYVDSKVVELPVTEANNSSINVLVMVGVVVVAGGLFILIRNKKSK